jgi:hypothetical protein
MRKLIVVLVVALVPFAAFAASVSKSAAIHQLLKLIESDSADESPDSHFAAFDRTMTEAQVSESVTFLTSPTGRQLLAAMREMSAAQIAQLNEAIARSKMRRTLADVRTLATALEALATDTNKYPTVKTLDELAKLLSPVYVLHMPRLDAWGHEYLYLGDPEHYRIVSGGPDGKITEASRQRSVKSGFGDDIVYEDGAFLAPTSNPE